MLAQLDAPVARLETLSNGVAALSVKPGQSGQAGTAKILRIPNR